MLLPIAPPCSTCAYRPSFSRVACAEQLDAFARHSHGCARTFVLARHNDIKNDLCDFAREAGLHAQTEQFAAEIPPDPHTATSGIPNLRPPTRHADVRIEAEPGEVVTWIDVNITATGQKRYGDWITKPAGKLVGDAENAKFTAWKIAPNAQVGGRLVPACLESQGRLGPRLVRELSRLAQAFVRRHSTATPVAEPALRAAVLGRWRRRLSVTLQRGNARILRACLGACPAQSAVGAAEVLVA